MRTANFCRATEPSLCSTRTHLALTISSHREPYMDLSWLLLRLQSSWSWHSAKWQCATATPRRAGHALRFRFCPYACCSSTKPVLSLYVNVTRLWWCKAVFYSTCTQLPEKCWFNGVKPWLLEARKLDMSSIALGAVGCTSCKIYNTLTGIFEKLIIRHNSIYLCLI